MKYSTNSPRIRSENSPFTSRTTSQKRQEKKIQRPHIMWNKTYCRAYAPHMCQLLTTSLLSEVCKSQKLTVPAADFGRKLLSYTFFQTRPVLRPLRSRHQCILRTPTPRRPFSARERERSLSPGHCVYAAKKTRKQTIPQKAEARPAREQKNANSPSPAALMPSVKK